jgi:cobaltochelatase CobT
MKVVTFQNVAQRYAAVMGRRDKVRLTFGGTNAFTDGNTINLPALPAGTVLTPYQAKVFGGYLDHETGHIRWSDFKVLRDNQEKTSKDPVLKYLHNVLEDVFMENRQIERYPGSKDYLDLLCDHVDKESMSKIAESGKVPTWGDRVIQLIYKEAYAKYRGHDTKQIQGWLSEYPKLKAVEKAMKDLATCKNTQQTYNLAVKVRALLPDDLDYSGKAPQAGNTVMVMMGQPQPGQGQPQPGQFGQSEPGQEQPAQVQPGPIQPGREAEAAQALEQAAKDGAKAAERGFTLVKLLKNIEKTNELEERVAGDHPAGKTPRMGGVEYLPPAGTHHDRIFVPARENMAEFVSTRSTAASEITALEKMLRIYLASKARRAWSRGLEEGPRLDEAALYSLNLGNKHIYKNKRDITTVHTAVELMLDLSGSMDSRTVRMTAIVLAEALRSIPKMELQINGFTTNRNVYSGVKTGGRSVGLDILTFKAFETPYLKSRGRLGGIDCPGLTPLGEGMAYGFEALLPRKERKRVLWVVSDGSPYYYCHQQTNDFVLMQRIKNKCKRHGVILVGLGIGQGLPLKQYTEYYEEIEGVEDLPKAVLNFMHKVAE